MPCPITVKGSSECAVAEGVRLIRDVMAEASQRMSAPMEAVRDFLDVAPHMPLSTRGLGMGRGRAQTLPSWASGAGASVSVGKAAPSAPAPAPAPAVAVDDKDALIARLMAENAALKEGWALTPVPAPVVHAAPIPMPMPMPVPPLQTEPPNKTVNNGPRHPGLNPPPPRNTTNGKLNLPSPRGIGSTSNGSSSLNLPPPRNNVDLPPPQTSHKRKDRSAPAAVARSPVTTPIDSEPMSWDDIGIVRRSSASSSSIRSEAALASVPAPAAAKTFRRKYTEAPTNNDDDTEESPPKRARVDDATALKSMSVRNLKAEAAHFNVDLSGCCEKSDIVAQLQEAAGDPALSVPAANQF